MIEVIAKVGPKGQVLIPKILRQEHGIEPSGKVVLRDSTEGILITRQKSDPVEVFRRIAFSGKKTIVNIKKYEKEFQENYPKTRFT
ncbi:MAG: AbrB/MazE/SpoVT family DNA-binding domain-containing protein [archaeon]